MLNHRQEKFCLYYAETGDSLESYRKAGYKGQSEEALRSAALRLINKPFIKERLQELADQAASKKIANIREVQERLTSILRGELKEEQVVVEGYGEGCSSATIVERRPQLKDVIKAGETLAKMQGGFNSKLRVDVTIPVFSGEERLED